MNYNIPLVLEFVYNRLLNVHNENPNLDWMMDFKSSIDTIKSLANDYHNLLEIIALQKDLIIKTENISRIYKEENEQYQKLLEMYEQIDILNKKIQDNEKITAALMVTHAKPPTHNIS